MRRKTIRICPRHQHYKVPLIWTFAFPYKEYWCPYCGYTHGMLGAGIEVDWDYRLENKLERYKKFSKAFLHATSLTCCARTRYKREWILPNALPKKSKQYYARVRKNWKYKVKLPAKNK